MCVKEKDAAVRDAVQKEVEKCAKKNAPSSTGAAKDEEGDQRPDATTGGTGADGGKPDAGGEGAEGKAGQASSGDSSGEGPCKKLKEAAVAASCDMCKKTRGQ